MLLRASGKSGVDIGAVTDAKAADQSGVPYGGALVGFAEAAITGDEPALGPARTRVRECLGDAALVDAAAVIANFQRMVRIADGTGIPLDDHLQFFTEGLRAELDLARFGSSANTPEPTQWQRLLRRTLGPPAQRAFRLAARLRKR